MKKFKLKIFTSFTLFFTFLVISMSGIALFLSPKGRIANWIEWRFLGFTKDQWSEMHIVFITIFLIAGILHLFWFNWKVFWNYIKTRSGKGLNRRWEFWLSVLFLTILMAGVLWRIQPVISIVNLNNVIKDSYEKTENQPPVPHAETLTVSEFAEKIVEMPVEKLLMKLEQGGFPAPTPDITIEDLAKKYGVAPQKIYELFPRNEKTSATQELSGLGKLTLQECCAKFKVEMDTALNRLNEAGIEDVLPDEKLKTAADRNNMTPMEMATIILDR